MSLPSPASISSRSGALWHRFAFVFCAFLFLVTGSGQVFASLTKPAGIIAQAEAMQLAGEPRFKLEISTGLICGNDPVNRHDPLGLQAWASMEDAQRMNDGMRELMNGGLADMFGLLDREMKEANQKVASGQMSALEGFGTRLVGKFDQLMLGTFLFPWAYNDAAKYHGTYNPGEIIVHQGIVNGVLVNGSKNLYRAFTQRDFGSVMDSFDSGVDAALIWKGGTMGFGRNRLPVAAGAGLSQDAGLSLQPMLFPEGYQGAPGAMWVGEPLTLAPRYHYAPTEAISAIVESGVLRATDTAAPLLGMPKAWVTTIIPSQMTGPLGWLHRMRLGFNPFKNMPTPHLIDGRWVFRTENAFIRLELPISELQQAPWWKAPFGGQEFLTRDILLPEEVVRGGL